MQKVRLYALRLAVHTVISCSESSHKLEQWAVRSQRGALQQRALPNCSVTEAYRGFRSTPMHITGHNRREAMLLSRLTPILQKIHNKKPRGAQGRLNWMFSSRLFTSETRVECSEGEELCNAIVYHGYGKRMEEKKNEEDATTILI